MSEPLDRVVVLDAQDDSACPRLPIVEGDGEARAVVWPGMGARHRSMHRVRLGARARTIVLRHPGEAVWYVVDGHGSVVDEDGGEAQDLIAGSMVHVASGDGYRLVAGEGEMRLAGGPCPPDLALYAHLDNA